MNKLFGICLIANVLFGMDAPLAHHNSEIFKSLGIIETDELINSTRGDFGMYVPDQSFIHAHPEVIAFAPQVINKTHALVMIKKINDRIGYGVFAQQPIAPGAVVGEYTGNILQHSQVYGRSLDDTRYVMELGPFGVDIVSDIRYDLYIDAKSAGNFTRFINHSYQPNLTEKLVFAKGLWHILLVANASIATGTQLSIDYGHLYWQARKITPIDL